MKIQNCYKIIANRINEPEEQIELQMNELKDRVLTRVSSYITSTEDKYNEQVIDTQIMSLLSLSDFYRVIILPTTVLQMSADTSIFASITLFKWEEYLYHLLILWLRISIVDKVTDGEAIEPDLLNISKLLTLDLTWELKGYLEVVEEGYEKYIGIEYQRLSDYVYRLIDRYHPYGEYVSQSVHDIKNISLNDANSLSYFLTNIIVISQLLDDIVDGKRDILEGNPTYISLKAGLSSKQGQKAEISTEVLVKTIFEVVEYTLKHIEMVGRLKFEDPNYTKLSEMLLQLFKDELGNVVELYKSI